MAKKKEGKGKELSFSDVQMTDRTRKLLVVSQQITNRMGSRYVSSEHVLLAMSEYENCGANSLLQTVRLDMDELKILVETVFGDD